MQDFAQHSEVLKHLPKATQQRGFNRLLWFFLSVPIYKGYDLTEPFPVPNKALKFYNYHRYKDIAKIYIKRVGGYSESNCYSYQFTPEFFNSNIPFTDTEARADLIDKSFKSEIVSIIENGLKSISINTEAERVKTKDGLKYFDSKPIRTTQQANIYFNRYLTKSIDKNYIVNRLGINLNKGTYFYYGINKAIDKPLDVFIAEKAKSRQMAGGYVLNAIRQKQFYASISQTNHRANTSFTSISEILHQYVKMDNEPIQGKDLSNSQFLLLAHLIENCTHSSEKSLLKFITDNGYLSDYIGKGKDIYTLSYLIDKFKNIVSKVNIESDATEFMQAAFNGTIYSDFATKTGLTQKMGEKAAREYTKTIFILSVFGKNDESAKARQFKEVYPSVWEIVKAFKNATAFNVLPILLQRIESIIFIDTLFVLLHYKGIKALTKHDSIYTKKSDYKRMIKTVTNVLDKILNKNYHLKD